MFGLRQDVDRGFRFSCIAFEVVTSHEAAFTLHMITISSSANRLYSGAKEHTGRMFVRKRRHCFGVIRMTRPYQDMVCEKSNKLF